MSGLQMKYFVLKPEGNNVYAEASRCAMRAYAKYIAKHDEALFIDLGKWASSEAREADRKELLRVDALIKAQEARDARK